MIIEPKLVERALERLNELDKQAVDMMAGGLLQDFNQYCRQAGRRTAIEDAKNILRETLEEVMKE